MSLSSCCASGHAHTGTPTGTVEKIAGLDVYVAKSSNGSKAKSVVFIADIFGWHLTNTRLLADEYAKSGLYVYVPDFLDGDPVDEKFLSTLVPTAEDQENPPANPGPKTDLGTWIGGHGDDVTRPRVDAFVDAVRKDLPEGGKLGAVGFCFGARYATLIGSKDATVDAVVVNHPSLITPEEIGAATVPYLVNIGDKDNFFPVEQITQVKEQLGKNKDLVWDVQVYPRAAHGFAVRGDISQEYQKVNRDKALHNTTAWFNKHLA